MATTSVRATPPGNRTNGSAAASWRVATLRMGSAAAGGAALYFGTAPRTWWWSAILGLALLGVSLHGTRWRLATAASVLFGSAYFIPLLSWSGVYVGATPWLGLALMEALLVAPAGVLIAVSSRRLPGWPWFAAAAWALGEGLRARFPFGGFAWGGAAYTQADGPLLPAAALLGSAGLSFLVALGGFALAEVAGRLWLARRGRLLPLRPVGSRIRFLLPGLLALLTPIAVSGIGSAVQHDTAADPQTVIAVIQGNVPRAGLDFNAQRRAVLDNHAARTAELADDVRAGRAPQPTLVLWPENSSDIDPYLNTDAASIISAAASDIGVPILVGAVVATDDPLRNYNMGIVWDPVTGPGETYTKRRPVPFAEYMPWRPFFRLLSDKVDLLRGEFLPGDKPGNLDIAGVKVGDVICFEIVEDGVVRDVVAGGAQLIVVQTNNATFGYTDETWQQQAMSRVRAVEHGRDVLIAATSGVSAVIRSDGRVDARIPLFTPGYLTPSVGLASASTPATAVGGVVEWLLIALTPLGLLAGAVRSRHRTTRPAQKGAS